MIAPVEKLTSQTKARPKPPMCNLVGESVRTSRPAETTQPQRAFTERAKIVETAEQIVSRGGVTEADVAQIAAAADVAPASFYEIFDDLDQVLLEVFDRFSLELLEAIQAAYSEDGQWLDKLRASLSTVLAYLDEQPERARFLIVDSLARDHRLAAARSRLLTSLAAALDSAVPESQRAKSTMPYGAAAVVGGVVSVLHARLIERSAAPLSDIAPLLMAVLLLPYLTSRQAREELRRCSSGTRPG